MTVDATQSRSGYTGTAKTLHWLIVALLIAQFIFAWTMPGIRRDTPVTTLISLHFTFGVIVLAVAVIRLLVRLVRGAPAPEPGIPAWQETSSQIVHWLLYALLLIVPLLGWINADFRGMPIIMFGYQVPHLIAARTPGWQWTGDVHGLLANYVMLALIGLHVLGALYHHFVMRDGVLKRMLPGR
ncbi:MAG: cytochrome b [Proteobacteria bacterium]|nr:cytochrome b [Pseudomonadota bacterium]